MSKVNTPRVVKQQIDWSSIYRANIHKLNLYIILCELNLNPKELWNRYLVDCPSCGQNEAWIYKGRDIINCNRSNNCPAAEKGTILLSLVPVPSGRFSDKVRLVFEKSCIPIPCGEHIKTETKIIPATVIPDIDNIASIRISKQKIWREFHRVVVEALHSDIGKCGYGYLVDRLNIHNNSVATATFIKQEAFGYYPDKEYIFQELIKLGYLPEEIYSSGIYRPDWSQSIIIIHTYQDQIKNFISGDITGTRKDAAGNLIKYSNLGSKYGACVKVPYGLGRVVEKEIVVVEGHFCLFNLRQCGIRNIVALGGDTLTSNHYKALEDAGINKITLLFDDDIGGHRGTMDVIDKYADGPIKLMAINPKWLKLRNAKDPDIFIRANGIEQIKDIIKSAPKNALEYKSYLIEGGFMGSGHESTELITGLSVRASDNRFDFEKGKHS